MRKIRCLIAIALMIVLTLPLTAYAGTWKTVSIDTTTSSYTSSAVRSDSTFWIDLVTYQSRTNNIGKLEVQVISLTTGQWTTVQTITKTLNVGSYTHFNYTSSYTGSTRIKFTSNYSVNLSGSLQYYNE